MRTIPFTMLTAVSAALFVLASCKQEEPPAPPTPSTAPLAAAPQSTPPAGGMGELPPGHPPIGGQAPGATAPGGDVHAGMPVLPKAGERKMLETAPTTFPGLTLTPPAGWQAFDASGSAMAPVAAFLLSPAEGVTGDAEVRLTHFPSMRGMPIETNLDRWFNQVQQPDGKSTKDVAKVETFEAGGAKITVADMSGAIGGATGQRLIAAEIAHPQGPHFLKVAGPEATVAKWRDSVIEYLKSAQVTP